MTALQVPQLPLFDVPGSASSLMEIETLAASLVEQDEELSDADLQALLDADEMMMGQQGETSSCCSGTTTGEEDDLSPPSSPGGDLTSHAPMQPAPPLKAITVPQPPATAWAASSSLLPLPPPSRVPRVPGLPGAVSATTTVEVEVSADEQPKKRRRAPKQERTPQQKLMYQLERRRKNKESADRSRWRKQQLLEQLPKEKAELQAKVSQLEAQLAAANAENASLKEQNSFLRSLVTGHALEEGAAKPRSATAVLPGAAPAESSAGTGMFLAALACVLTVHQISGLLPVDDEDAWGASANGSSFGGWGTAAPARRDAGRVLLGLADGAAASSFGGGVRPLLRLMLVLVVFAWAAPRFVHGLAAHAPALPLFDRRCKARRD